jgi:hypothetical protein
VAPILAENNCPFTFNMFSAPVGYTGDLRHTPQTCSFPTIISLPTPTNWGCMTCSNVPIRE